MNRNSWKRQEQGPHVPSCAQSSAILCPFTSLDSKALISLKLRVMGCMEGVYWREITAGDVRLSSLPPVISTLPESRTACASGSQGVPSIAVAPGSRCPANVFWAARPRADAGLSGDPGTANGHLLNSSNLDLIVCPKTPGRKYMCCRSQGPSQFSTAGHALPEEKLRRALFDPPTLCSALDARNPRRHTVIYSSNTGLICANSRFFLSSGPLNQHRLVAASCCGHKTGTPLSGSALDHPVQIRDSSFGKRSQTSLILIRTTPFYKAQDSGMPSSRSFSVVVALDRPPEHVLFCLPTS
ncbi:hypothetical protein BC834DRAFT_542380 [Gloeopeniophorella convolvens]|nr:hypothetical protein BC834DRAFT_542380 [Gloeopeniophorella convolvens]